ncbi:MAG TPA: hypothetical protein VHM70_09190 [Polyangiaceae bacterium]|jgi:hypothetical protein|nr:hypothetical protein [Polyangiaceae bacterium]
MDLLHRVVAIVGAQPKRVECQTCHTQHNYRAPKNVKSPSPKTRSTDGASAKAPRSAAKTSSIKQTRQLHDWENHIAGKDQGAFRNYSISSRFERDELIRHKTFGEGCVLEVLQDQKINVLFREGVKVLVHDRAAAAS